MSSLQQVALAAEPPAKSGAAPLAGISIVDRGFVRVAEGPVHYRFLGRPGHGDVPLLMAHAAPGSSSGLAGLIGGLGRNRFVMAPDMLGFGDLPAPAHAETDIPYYVDATIRVMDALGVKKVDFYGAHTGAQIGCQMAVDHPERIRKLVLDGIALFPPAFKQELVARYAPQIVPDEWGGHLSWAWNFVRDQSLFWPHYAQDGAHRLANSVGSPEQLQRGVLDVLKALSTYHIGYRAAFKHDVHSLLPKITQRTLVMSIERDPLHVYIDEAVSMIKNAQRVMIATDAGQAGKLDVLASFFAA